MSDAVGTCSVVKRCCKYAKMRFVLPTFSSPTTTHLIALPDFFRPFFVFFDNSKIEMDEKRERERDRTSTFKNENENTSMQGIGCPFKVTTDFIHQQYFV